MKNRIKHLIIIAFAALFCTTAQAQTEAETETETETEAQTEAQAQTYYEIGRVGILVSTGVQYLNHPNSTYWASRTSLSASFGRVFSILNPECLLLDISFGANYFSINPWGSVAMEIAILGGGRHSPITWGGICLGILLSPRLHIPIGKHFDVFAGWDALKLTRMKDISNAWYVTGDLRSGFNYYVTKNLFVNVYYEFNHNYNWVLDIAKQPKALNGHSIGIQIGYFLF